MFLGVNPVFEFYSASCEIHIGEIGLFHEVMDIIDLRDGFFEIVVNLNTIIFEF